ncbi:unnamed protein product [Prunus armeniaca]|uniref:Uncharacterized protein n=1 Tax=Prunus armeniaca TaxID=36596 RepID=A0A6J5XMS2_PRUAR|nr:unnamed protein product [Prunus armeniaca]
MGEDFKVKLATMEEAFYQFNPAYTAIFSVMVTCQVLAPIEMGEDFKVKLATMEEAFYQFNPAYTATTGIHISSISLRVSKTNRHHHQHGMEAFRILDLDIMRLIGILLALKSDLHLGVQLPLGHLCDLQEME